MIKFNSFEEISSAHPINPEHNQSFTVRHAYKHVFTYQDIDIIKQLHPNGWLDREGHRYYYYDILACTWYTHYIYDGENWCLGIDSWDGIQVAEEPTWGVQRECNFQRTEFGVFKTKAEAINYKNRKLEERLEF
jgi:hypothetical protein